MIKFVTEHTVLVLFIFSVALATAGNTAIEASKRAIGFPCREVVVSYPKVPEWFDRDLLAYIGKQADNFGVPRLLALRLIEVESEFRPGAYHHNSDDSEDVGLFQINTANFESFPVVFGEKGKKYDIRANAYDNAFLGLSFLASLHRATGDWRQAVMAYNAGLAIVKNGDMPARTVRYADKIMPVPEWWKFPDGTVIDFWE